MDNYFVCRVAIAPLRKEPSDRSEIVSQLLFGDRVTVIEQSERWWYVNNLYDGYEGWMDFKQLQQISALQFQDDDRHKYLAPRQIENKVVAEDGSTYYLAAGSTLPFYNDGNCCLGDKAFEVHFNPILPTENELKNELLTTALFFKNSPYLWGGRTPFGIDCSGFSQTVYKLLGIKLNRDASQQAEQGESVGFLASAQLGDLAFFDNEDGEITHVGVMLSNDKIIHASGSVKIDPIDNQGIYNTELGKYTHNLRIIKRFFA